MILAALDPAALGTLITAGAGAVAGVGAFITGRRRDSRVVHKDELTIVVDDQRTEITALRAARAVDQTRIDEMDARYRATITGLELRVRSLEDERQALANKVWMYEKGILP